MRSRRALEAGLLMMLAMLAALLAGCGEVKSPTEPFEEIPEGAAFTFSEVQARVFTPSCARSGCHAASTGSGAR